MASGIHTSLCKAIDNYTEMAALCRYYRVQQFSIWKEAGLFWRSGCFTHSGHYRQASPSHPVGLPHGLSWTIEEVQGTYLTGYALQSFSHSQRHCVYTVKCV